MPTRVLHVSDLHTGTRADAAVERALAALVERVEPELVIASGDLTHRGRPDQHERAAAFLKRLGPPVLAVPGNHDIPLAFPARFTRPWREFERHWQTTEPLHSSASLQVVGVNSVRPWRHQSGGVRGSQLDRATERLRAGVDGAFRIVVLHHQLIGSPWRARRKKPVARRNEVLGRLVDSGAELIVGGHIHQGAVSTRAEFEISTGADEPTAVVSIAPGLGQPRPNRRGEARGLQVYAVEPDALEVETYIWRADGWGLTAVRRFPRGTRPFAVVAQEAPAPPQS